MRGRKRSSANLVAPVTLAVASTLRSAFPTTRRAVGCSAVFPTAGPPDRLTAAFLREAIQGLRRGLRIFALHAGGRQLHRLIDLDVARAPAQVARQRELDLLARGTRA